MFNPFLRFMPELIAEFRQHGERYVVSQTFKGTVDIFSDEKDMRMFLQYNESGFAQIHLNARRIAYRQGNSAVSADNRS